MAATTVLVVEDEKIIARGIEKRLKALGYTVVGLAANANEALTLANQYQPDLVLMDIHLGQGMDGIDLAHLLHQRSNIPIVYLTAHSDEATLERAKVTYPFGYVLKPYEDKDLQTAIEMGLYRHKSEQRLRDNEQRLAATLAGIGDALVAIDSLGRVEFLNAVAEKLTGWALQEARAQPVEVVVRLVDEEQRQPIPNPAREAMAMGITTKFSGPTLILHRRGSECPVEDSAAPIRDVQGNIAGAVMVFRDITERRQLEEQLRQSQKMEAIGRLAGGIAHDFNNILTVIIGYSDMLLDDPPPWEDCREYARQIHDAGKRAAELTQQILAFSRRQILAPNIIQLNAIVRDIAVLVRRLLGSSIQLVTKLEPDLGVIKADPSQLGQVLLNLCVNARDAMVKGGTLTISTANVTLDHQAVTHRKELNPGTYAMLTVEDTGCGMDDAVLAHLFEPFFTTKEVGKGTGLGLASVHGIIKQSGGHIEVSTVVGVGSAFRILFPVVASARDPGTVMEAPALAKGTETILLVEDEDSVRRMTKMLLHQAGYHVLEAAHGPGAIALSAQHQDIIHLLLSDLEMPEMSGRRVADILKESRPTMRVLFMSGYSVDDEFRQQVADSTAAFLPKPFTNVALTNMVRFVLDQE